MSCSILRMNRLRRLQWGRLAGRRGDWGWSMINPTATITHCNIMEITERRSLFSTTETELFKQHFKALLFVRIAFRLQENTFLQKLHPHMRSGLPPYFNLLKAKKKSLRWPLKIKQCPVSTVRIRTFKKKSRSICVLVQYSSSFPTHLLLCDPLIYLVESQSDLF